jgi:hypothetical protein
MKFKDFENDYSQLVGKTVLCSSRYNSAIQTIEKVTKTGFRITNDSGLYGLSDGIRKGGDGWSITRCELLTQQQAEAYKAKEAVNKEAKSIREEIKTKADSLDIETLRKIKSLL